MPGERIIKTQLGPEAEGQRLDLFLASRFTYRSRTEWQAAVKRGEIRLNDRPTRASRLLHEGETLSFQPSEQDLAEPPVDFNFSVIEDTPDLLAVSKSGNIPVHPSGRYFQHTLLMALETQFGRLFPVNRIDRETSGVVLYAKSPNAAKLLGQLLEKDGMKKTYTAIVFGDFPDELHAAGFLSADPDSPVNKKRRFTFEQPDGDPETQTAKTHFYCVARGAGMSIVECLPGTGRLHQIRATLCSLGFPLVGDKLYGPDDSIYLRFLDNALTERDIASLRIPRQALHAASLQFHSPFNDSELFLKAPLPDDLLSLQDEIYGV